MSSRFQVPNFRLIPGLAFWLILIVSCNSGTKKAAPVNPENKTGIAKFVFSEEMHNFGSLKAGEIVSFTFVFRNEGTKTLVIEKVESGCKCTEVVIPNKSIEPEKEGQIEVIYNSAGEVGRQLQTITVFSNADQPEKQLFIKANITNELIEIHS